MGPKWIKILIHSAFLSILFYCFPDEFPLAVLGQRPFQQDYRLRRRRVWQNRQGRFICGFGVWAGVALPGQDASLATRADVSRVSTHAHRTGVSRLKVWNTLISCLGLLFGTNYYIDNCNISSSLDFVYLDIWQHTWSGGRQSFIPKSEPRRVRHDVRSKQKLLFCWLRHFDKVVGGTWNTI